MTAFTDLAPEAADEILTTRRYAAPRALVYEAWTAPEHLDAWWGPNGFATRTSAMDMRDGGEWRFTMTGPDGKVWSNCIRYTEIVPAQRLVYEHGDGQPGADPHFHVTVVFADDGDGTLLAMRARFPSAEARRFVVENVQAIEGGRQTLERLARYVDSRR